MKHTLLKTVMLTALLTGTALQATHTPVRHTPAYRTARYKIEKELHKNIPESGFMASLVTSAVLSLIGLGALTKIGPQTRFSPQQKIGGAGALGLILAFIGDRARVHKLSDKVERLTDEATRALLANDMTTYKATMKKLKTPYVLNQVAIAILIGLGGVGSLGALSAVGSMQGIRQENVD